jgi:hypothetical protein
MTPAASSYRGGKAGLHAKVRACYLQKDALWPDGTLFEMVHLGREELTNENLDQWIYSIPIKAD